MQSPLRIRDRRKATKYTERLTSMLIWMACSGSAWVILDPVIIIPLACEGCILKLGASGFSNDLKGAVIGTVIVGTIAAVLKRHGLTEPRRILGSGHVHWTRGVG